jgi:CheY-like chemotaxis protein
VLFALQCARRIKNPHTQDALFWAGLLVLAGVLMLFAAQTTVPSSAPYGLIIPPLVLGALPVLSRLQSACLLALCCLLGMLVLNASSGSMPQLLVEPSTDQLMLLAFHVFSLAISWISSTQLRQRVVLLTLLDAAQQSLDAQVEQRTAAYRERIQAAEASNMAKTRFLTRVSHELRTSMNTIAGMVFLAREHEDPASREAYLDDIEYASRKLTGIVNTIIDTTKIEVEFAGDDLSKNFALVGDEEWRPAAPEEPQEAPDLTNRTILIVEDLPTNRVVLKEFLRETKATIEEAENGRIAVEMFSASPEGYYSYVFMDLLRPEMNGHDATRTIRSLERPDATSVPIVAVSANAYREDIEASLASGMDAHLAKPLNRATLLRTLKERLAP